MRPGKFHLLRVAGLLLGAATCLCAGNFASPAEGPVAFRRDRIPLDAETMAGLSRQLVTLTEGLDFKAAVKRRAAAQMLALAAALDPANGKSRELISAFQIGRQQPVADPEQIEKSKAVIWQDLGWLETPEAGSQGQALAACLTDVMVVFDPGHPRAEAIRAAGERGAWKDWVPELAAYEVEAKPIPPEKPMVAMPAILLSKAQVFTPLWKMAGMAKPSKWILRPAPLQMSAAMIPTAEGGQKPFSILIGSDGGSPLSQLSGPLLQILTKQHGSLPANGRVTIHSAALDTSLLSGKRQSLSAAAAVLASAAISGREPDATIIGVIDETGAFKLPTEFWNQLQSLGRGTGGRLVLPAAAAGYLPSMLALEKPGFFLEYEVLLASDFQELLDLTEKIPGAALANASAKFHEIRTKAGSQAVSQYVANSFVRRRLTELAKDAPYHFSAKMLAIQGAGNRPVFLSRMVLASELRRAIEPMDWIVKRTNPGFELLESSKLSSSYETCRTQVAAIARHADRDDHELLGRVQNLFTAIRTLEHAAKTRGEIYTFNTEYDTAHSALMRTHREVAAELAVAAGDAEAVPAN